MSNNNAITEDNSSQGEKSRDVAAPPSFITQQENSPLAQAVEERNLQGGSSKSTKKSKKRLDRLNKLNEIELAYEPLTPLNLFLSFSTQSPDAPIDFQARRRQSLIHPQKRNILGHLPLPVTTEATAPTVVVIVAAPPATRKNSYPTINQERIIRTSLGSIQ